MYQNNWLKHLGTSFFGRSCAARQSRYGWHERRRPSTRPCLETLEERCLLSGGPTTPTGLVSAINNANAAGGGTVTLSSGAAPLTIDFTGINNTTNGGNALPLITTNITIVGIGNGVTIERNQGYLEPYRFFDVASGGSLTLENLTLQYGLAQGTGTSAEGGAIYATSSGSLTLSGVTVRDCKAEANPAAGYGTAKGGGIFYDGEGSVFLSNYTDIDANEAVGSNHSSSGYGGGVCVSGAHGVTLANDTFNDNSAIGASGNTGPQSGAGGNGGSALGGGLYVLNSATTVIISNDNFTANGAVGGKAGNGGAGADGGNGGTGGEAEGGGLYVDGSNLTLNGDSIGNNVVTDGNVATGGYGGNGGSGELVTDGSGGPGGPAYGGGVFTTNIPYLPTSLGGTGINKNSAIGGGGGTRGVFGTGGSNGENGGSYGQQMYGNAMSFSTTSPLPGGTVNQSYSATITASPYISGSSPRVSYSPPSSSLGLSFNTDGNELIISGTPTKAGTIQFTVTGADSVGTTQAQEYSLTINPSSQPPAFTSPTSTTFVAGTPSTFTVTATGSPTPALSESGALPGGVTFNTATATLSGTPAAGSGGVYTLHFAATNSAGSVGQTFTLTVDQAPAIITNGNNPRFTVGQSGSFTLTVTGWPTPSLTESGALPGGVTFTNNGNGTATLSGTPAAGTQGTYQFTITAHNGVGSNFTQNFTLTVNPAPSPPPPPPPPLPHTPIVPPLLALFNQFLGDLETVNANGTTITDNLFGFPMVETYDYFGNLVSVDLFGFDVTFLFE